MCTMSAKKGPNKVPTNLSLRADLVSRARALGMNISEAVDEALEDLVRRAERRAWLQQNASAIASYNDRVERRGVFSDEWRKF